MLVGSLVKFKSQASAPKFCFVFVFLFIYPGLDHSVFCLNTGALFLVHFFSFPKYSCTFFFVHFFLKIWNSWRNSFRKLYQVSHGCFFVRSPSFPFFFRFCFSNNILIPSRPFLGSFPFQALVICNDKKMHF